MKVEERRVDGDNSDDRWLWVFGGGGVLKEYGGFNGRKIVIV